MAIWRRRLALPEGLRAAHEDALEEAMAGLEEDYPVYVDECVCWFACFGCDALTCGLQAASAYCASQEETQLPVQAEVAQKGERKSRKIMTSRDPYSI